MHGVPQGSHGHSPWQQQPPPHQPPPSQQQQPSGYVMVGGYAMAGASPSPQQQQQPPPPQQQQQQQQQQQHGWGADGQIAPQLAPSEGGGRVQVSELVPTRMVTRIIGKGGSVVNDIRARSGATINIDREEGRTSGQQAVNFSLTLTLTPTVTLTLTLTRWA